MCSPVKSHLPVSEAPGVLNRAPQPRLRDVAAAAAPDLDVLAAPAPSGRGVRLAPATARPTLAALRKKMPKRTDATYVSMWKCNAPGWMHVRRLVY